MIRMHQSALATVASELNQLWAGCKRVSCAMYDVEAYDSVGSCEPAKLVVTQSKCQRVLEDNAAGVAKAWQQTSPLRILAASCVSRTELIHASEQWHGRRLSGYISPS